MENLLQNRVVVEFSTVQNVSYVLNRNEDFLITEYKVLKTKTSMGLIKCSKLLYNGKVKLVYFTNGLKPLNTLWNSINDDSCIRILTNLFNTVIELKNNGFLNCHNLVISEDRIFVDVNTLAVYLIYLPICNQDWDVFSFESDLRARILKSLSSNSKLISIDMRNVGNLLSNGTLSIEEIYHHMCKGEIENNGKYVPPTKGNTTYGVHLISLDTHQILDINRSEYKIGKNASLVDGVIGFNKAISRLHCQISVKNNEFYLIDLGSANGTYVNKVKIAANQRIKIKDGDIIRLANSDFKFQVGEV